MVGEDVFKKFSKLFFLGVILVTLGFAYFIKDLKFDYDFEKFFPLNDEETAFYFNHRKQFQSDNDFLLIAIERKQGVFDLDFLKKVEACKKSIEKLKYVRFVRSISSEKENFLLTGGRLSSKPYISYDPNKFKEDSARIYRHRELVNSLVAEDGKSLCLFIKHKDYLPGVKSTVLIEEITRIVESYPFEKVRIAGRTIGQKFYIEKMGFEMVLFVAISLVLVILFLWIAFRSIWGVLLPQLVIFFTMIWIIGSMGLFGEPVNIILSVLPSIMFVVAMSDVIHLVSRYLDALRSGLSKIEAIKVSLKEVGMATLLTSITTTIGFMTLITINVQPIQSFGIITGIGVLIAFLVTILVLPVSFYIFPSPKRIMRPQQVPIWNELLRRWFIAILRKRKRVLAISGIIITIFSLLIFRVESNNYMMDDLSANEPIKQDFNFLDEHYGGIRPVELAINVSDSTKNCWSLDVLQELNKVEGYLENNFGAKMNVSLLTYIKVLNQSAHVGNPSYFKLPETKRALKKLKKPIKIARSGKLYRMIVDSTDRNVRVSAAVPDWGNQKVKAAMNQFKEFIRTNVDEELIQVRFTGTAHLLDKNMDYLSFSLVRGILLSVFIITLIMGFVYKSWKMVLISLVPNVLPLIILGGLMGLFKIDLKISTAIIFTISFGIAVDDTIHFLSKLKLELSKGKSMLYALKSTYLTTGKAMILTTLILVSGFLMLLFSSFMGTFIMGFMISITLFVALIADLTLLPVLLWLFYKPTKK